MVLPAAITTVLLGVTIGVTLYFFTNLFNSPTAQQYEEPRSNVIRRKAPQKRRPEFKADDDCSVCMNSFNSKNQVKELRCGHFLHNKCYEALKEYTSTCPLCREFIA
ncbi:uncharacterized protein LOC143914353 [Arctopsyche grandis]|uniref:uncharacterized protein LOC143914353 n=1 Tax=Arctopsyche grandis TaxID=121162 RepID=UPI00406D6778